ncbi:MAG: hypothetical protein AMXMBFR64_19530 [Myxococcales bacterium]
MRRYRMVVALTWLGLAACNDGGSSDQGNGGIVDSGAAQDAATDLAADVPTGGEDTSGPDASDEDAGELPDAAPDAAPDTADAAPDVAADTGPDPTSCVVLGCDTSQDTACRTAKCVPETGKCIQAFEPSGKPCNDGDPGTENDACYDGVCKGQVATCVCNVDADCKSYDDGNLCNGIFVCSACKCVVDPGSIVACDTSSDDQCNATVCKPATGKCEKAPALNGTSCDDGDVCSKGDKCTGGVCGGSLPADHCASDAECAAFDDGDVCNGVWTCQTDGLGCGHCLYAPETLVTCDTAGLPPCVKAECIPATGECEQQPVFNGAFCKLGDGSTGNCLNGTCLSKAPPCVCEYPGACDDGDPCTADTCTGCACTHTAIAGCCTSDASCDDLDPCTTDHCTPSGCASTPVACYMTDPSCPSATDIDPLCCDAVAQCEDGLPSTAHTCVDHRCDDSLVECTCTTDLDCDDGNLCTTETCNGCVCEVAPIAGCCAGDGDCDDGDPCTVDACEADSTCSHTPSGVPLCCATSSDCGGTLVCWAGTCALKPSCADGCKTPADCNDGDPWTLDTCATGPQGCGVCHHTK